MERLTQLYAIMNSMENLRFGKEDYFHVLVSYELFYKRNRKHFFSCFPYVIHNKHSWKFGRTRNDVEILTVSVSTLRAQLQLQFLVLPNFH